MPLEYSEIVDLSQPWSRRTPAFPTDSDPVVRWVKRLATHGTNHQAIESTLHVGTHIDAPLHFLDEGGDVAGIDLNRLIRPGVIIDISDRVVDHGLIEPEMLDSVTTVQSGDIVIIHTGYHRFSYYEDTADPTRYFFKHPGGGQRLADWAISHDIGFLGVDMASPDHAMNSNLRALRPEFASEASSVLGSDIDLIFPKEGFQVMHTALFAASIPIVENVGGEIDSVLNQRLTIAAIPWRFEGGEAAFVRVVAFRP